MNLLSSWSGGKDSCFALMQTLKNNNHHLKAIMNMMNENAKVSRSHGIPLHILEQHAKALGVDLIATPASWGDYEQLFIKGLKEAKQQYQIDAVVFGDIDLEPHRLWEEKVCLSANVDALLPLWQQNRRDLVIQMVDSGIEAIITSCNTTLGESFLGRTITKDIISEFEALGIDACGENGEYHTLVVNCPLFKQKIAVSGYRKTVYQDYCFLTWD